MPDNRRPNSIEPLELTEAKVAEAVHVEPCSEFRP